MFKQDVEGRTEQGVLEMGHGPVGPSRIRFPQQHPLTPDTVSTMLEQMQRLGSTGNHQPRDNLSCKLQETQNDLSVHRVKNPCW